MYNNIAAFTVTDDNKDCYAIELGTVGVETERGTMQMALLMHVWYEEQSGVRKFFGAQLAGTYSEDDDEDEADTLYDDEKVEASVTKYLNDLGVPGSVFFSESGAQDVGYAHFDVEDETVQYFLPGMEHK